MRPQRYEPFVVWFTGVSGSGKTTLARKLRAKLRQKKVPAVIVDGDEIRKTISKDLGFSRKDITENHRRILALVKYHASKGKAVIVSVISPHRSTRRRARRDLKNFVEVFCDCPIEVLAKRDPKGHYARVRKGGIGKFIGIHQKYERPAHPEIALRTDKESPAESLGKMTDFLVGRGLL